ncbi:hypothetical protein [Paenarthrobacter nitroguajacolicus]|uniref:hypothetical protein n=1 Tax=Paenarthrobacter nitroguajacolicus TaxID=211146 RepID=UPI00248C6C9E|nr:hypothetical protein [Paenarthrobacter nitroguajacolicus]MDI2032995.1 hypothetical protein [Paenarthrobacter nitroguajacolicus]
MLPSALLWLIHYLDQKLTETVRGEVPRDRPTEFVLVSVAGGDNRTAVTGAVQALIESWAGTILEAEALAREVDGLVRKAPGQTVDGIYCKGSRAFGLPYESPDPDSGAARYRQLVSLTFRRTE